MRALLLALPLLLACGQPHQTPCGIDIGGDRDSSSTASSLTAEALQSAVRRALNGATFTTDPALADPSANCKSMEGFTVYTRATYAFIDEGEEVFGATRCWKREVIVGTPESGSWQFSGLVHELFHVMQRCSSPLPVDDGRDEDHSNWDRDGIFLGIGMGVASVTCSGTQPVSCECVQSCAVDAAGNVTTTGLIDSCTPRCWDRSR